jgi:hypothetical protein
VSRFAYRDAVESDAEALSDYARATWVATFGKLHYPPGDPRAYLAAKYGVEIQRAEIVDPQTRYHLAFDGEDIAGYCMMGRCRCRSAMTTVSNCIGFTCMNAPRARAQPMY